MSLVKNWRPQLKEKVVYIDPNGTVYDLHNPIPHSLLSMSGWGMTPVDYGLTKGPYQHGLTVLTARLLERLIKIEIRHKGCDRNEYWQNRTGLIDILRYNQTNLNFPQPGHLRWYRANGTIRQADVYLSRGPEFNTLGNGAWDEYSFNDVLEFRAYNPVIYDPTELTSSLTSFVCENEESLTFPFEFGNHNISFGDIVCENEQDLVINYGGNWIEYPLITIDGPATDPSITHNETGNKIALTGITIATGQSIIIDLAYDSKTIVNDSDDNLLGYLTSDSTLGSFSIEPSPTAPNGVNTYTIQISSGSINTVVSFEYFNRYPGI